MSVTSGNGGDAGPKGGGRRRRYHPAGRLGRWRRLDIADEYVQRRVRHRLGVADGGNVFNHSLDVPPAL